ncbi:hypothetical protein K523DRAFT_358463 [Schizophyllum commune Tattone D]|nr:hypothetical protein K523DRAFT_358463 [Schizophyllum commune Tattone D]
MTDHVRIRLKRRAAAPVDAHTSAGTLPVRASSTTSRMMTARSPSLPPPCYLTPCYDATPRGRRLRAAHAPCTRLSSLGDWGNHARHGGEDVARVIEAAVGDAGRAWAWIPPVSSSPFLLRVVLTPVFSHFRGFLQPLKACADPLDEFTDAGEVLDPLAGTRETHIKVFSCDPEPPEARVRTPRAKDTKVKDPFILKPTRAGGLGANFDAFLRAPNRRRHVRAPSAKDAKGVGHPLPSRWILSLPTPSRRRRAREASGKDAKEGVFDRPEPPEACTRTLGEGCERGGIPLTPHGSLARRRERRGTAPFVEGGSLAHPTTTARRPERALRVLLREGEALHVQGGRGEISTTRYKPTRWPSRSPETDVFDEKDPFPSSLPASSRSSPTS